VDTGLFIRMVRKAYFGMPDGSVVVKDAWVPRWEIWDYKKNWLLQRSIIQEIKIFFIKFGIPPNYK
jgi:hypothetical protein